MEKLLTRMTTSITRTEIKDYLSRYKDFFTIGTQTDVAYWSCKCSLHMVFQEASKGVAASTL